MVWRRLWTAPHRSATGQLDSAGEFRFPINLTPEHKTSAGSLDGLPVAARFRVHIPDQDGNRDIYERTFALTLRLSTDGTAVTTSPTAVIDISDEDKLEREYSELVQAGATAAEIETETGVEVVPLDPEPILVASSTTSTNSDLDLPRPTLGYNRDKNYWYFTGAWYWENANLKVLQRLLRSGHVQVQVPATGRVPPVLYALRPHVGEVKRQQHRHQCDQLRHRMG